MSVQERKQRERAERERLIVATARELAEEQGWDAVTTRRLAERIEYSQPVLYSHFRGKREIIGAVALQGAAELAAELRGAAAEAEAGAGASASVEG
ncbi:helix-turn-helix domain-containing protein, partial [Streptomyces sp. Z38]